MVYKDNVSKLASIPSDNRPCDVMYVYRKGRAYAKARCSHFIHSFYLRFSLLEVVVRSRRFTVLLFTYHITSN